MWGGVRSWTWRRAAGGPGGLGGGREGGQLSAPSLVCRLQSWVPGLQSWIFCTLAK